MSLVIYTDPHIGLRRNANTTPAGRDRLQQAIINTLDGFLPESIVDQGDHNKYVCVGDLFDQYSNPEKVIDQGLDILYRTHMVLAGNHDVVADSDKIGSLQLIEGTPAHGDVIRADFGKPKVGALLLDDFLVVSVPHVTTQELFEKSLGMAIDYCLEHPSYVEGAIPILLLHCNYDSPYECTETSLNLKPDHALELLDTFSHIFMGHEHSPRDLLRGRLVILGNTHPTSFSDISDKRIAILDNVGGKAVVNFKQVWSKELGYLEIDVNEEGFIPATTTAQFVRVVGTAPADQMARVSKGVNTLWKNSPNLLAVRSEVAVTQIEGQDSTAIEATAETLPALIARELEADPAMKQMWEEFTS